jgi:hypothetical protein
MISAPLSRFIFSNHISNLQDKKTRPGDPRNGFYVLGYTRPCRVIPQGQKKAMPLIRAQPLFFVAASTAAGASARQDRPFLLHPISFAPMPIVLFCLAGAVSGSIADPKHRPAAELLDRC